MKLDFTMTKDPAQNYLLWELQATDGEEDRMHMKCSEHLNKHQTENLAYVPVEQLREDARLLLTQTAAQSSTEKLSQLAKDIVCAVIYQHLGKPWEPVDEYDTPPTYDPHWSKKLRHGEDI